MKNPFRRLFQPIPEPTRGQYTQAHQDYMAQFGNKLSSEEKQAIADLHTGVGAYEPLNDDEIKALIAKYSGKE